MTARKPRSPRGWRPLLLLPLAAALLGPPAEQPVAVQASAVSATADLQIADRDTISEASSCATAGPYVDAQTVSPMALVGASVGASERRHVCVRNAGADPAEVALAMVAATSTETGCTGDEPLVDPDGPTCGTTGELASDIAVAVGATRVGGAAPCAGTPADPLTFAGVADAAPRALGPPIPAGGYACYRIDAAYLAFTPPADVVQNQSDRATWRLRFVGTATDQFADPGDPAPGPGPGFLAATGANSVRLAAAGVALVLMGVTAVALARRRRPRAADHPD